jgi:hypothetical protein
VFASTRTSCGGKDKISSTCSPEFFLTWQRLTNALLLLQEDLMNLVNCLSPNDAANFQNLHSFSRYSRGSSASFAGDFLMDIATDRERDLLHQVSELQSRMASLVDELQTVKLRNVGLERQLNAIYNKEEEERIRKEEAAKEDG